jgi:uncharacterized membrane protein
MVEIVPNWHPIWVHFTIGLLTIGTLFYALAFAGKATTWAQQALTAARWNLIAGTLFAVAALVSGWLAANSVPHDNAGHANLLTHINWALIAAAIFITAVVWLGMQWRNSDKKASVPVLLLLLGGSAALTVTGFKGGANVFEHGLGVQRLPDIGRHDHAAHGHHHDESAGHEDQPSNISHPAAPEEENVQDKANEHASDVHIHSDGSEHHH